MHPSSFDKMAVFRRDYLESRLDEALVVLDLGSQDINGSYRSLFNQSPWRYIGVDLLAGEHRCTCASARPFGIVAGRSG